MAKPRVTTTDRLSNVIEVVELGQRSGLLAVERGAGSVLEEGEIYFVSGRAIYASLAGLRGREALMALSRWGACRFAFDRDAPRPAPNLSGTLSALAPEFDRGSQPNLPASQPGYPPPRLDGSGSWPVQPNPYEASMPGYGGMGYSGPLNGGGGMSYPGMGGNGMGPWQSGGSGYGTPPGYQTPQRAPLQTGPLQGYQGANVLSRRPRRAPDVHDLMNVVTTHNLSRSHRTILLLADGEHTVLDLARLSSKSVDEVNVLLGELEARGLVYYYE